MSESSDEELMVNRRNSSNSRRKRVRLSSDASEDPSEKVEIIEANGDHGDDHQEEDEEDEITIIRSNNSKHKGHAPEHEEVITLDDNAESEIEDDDEDDDSDDVHREDDEIIEDLYEDQEYPSERSAAAQKKIRSLRENVVEFFQTASAIDLESIPGVKKKKVEQLIALRPILSWEDLNRKIQHHKSAGISEDIVINAVKTIKSRSVVEKLMADCQKLAKDIEQLVDRLPEAPQPKCIPTEFKLAPYQLIGLNWLALMHSRGINGILADEMGLGKTIQVIAFLAFLRERFQLKRHHLIIVPASTLDNWEREFDVWCPEIRILQYYGTQELRAQTRFWVSKHLQEVDVIITTYNVAQNPEDRKLFKKIPFEYLIFDEAHMLKNMKSSRYQSLIKIRSKRRILLTGTPLQNNLVELMSLLVFTMPRMFMSKMDHVEALFSTASRDEGGRTEFEKERIEQAKKIMKPFVLRRLKEDVLKDLPTKSEETVLCPLSASQSRLYQKLIDSLKREINEHVHEVLDDDNSFAEDSVSDVKKGAGMLMAMRRLANHPLLMLNLYTKDKLKTMASLMLKEPTHRDANKDLIFDDMCVMHDFELHQLCKMYKSIESFKLEDKAITDSGKFKHLDRLLDDLRRSGQKCLIFSQFTMMLDIMEEFLTIKGYNYLRLDGSTKVSDRIDLIDSFNSNAEMFIFLLSTKAGGLGINLTAANVVIIHDIDFNPYNDKQAEDRSHRLGQTRAVKVYKLISKGTVEEGMLDIAEEKLKLGRNLSDHNRENDAPATKDMRSLLRSTLKLQ